ncbi:hypothetical protein [Roseimaritima ulvae]|uniref:Uncharacterized protein n=1 Tax=Roseimaritima ulvae TaxID=980254 RepID=A0A5B9QWN6_9BACT|nr:hypothetical protein [Roseimaritima ulvae]QEG43458.1 hypothetical protein UC8_55070 [Roseimaritima ulvae]
MAEGWIRLHRQLLDSIVFQDENLLRLFLYLLLRATSNRQCISMRTGRGQTLIKLARGQTIVGREAGSDALGWPPSTFRNRLAKLQELGMVEIVSRSHFSIVTITNWSTYQRDTRTTKGQANSQGKDWEISDDTSQHAEEMDNQRTGNGQPKDTYKKAKKVKKAENTSCEPSDLRSAPLASEFEFLIKSANGETWSLSREKFSEYVGTFGNPNWVKQELRKARQWCSDNKAKRKTPAGMERFLTGWLSRANDRGSHPQDSPAIIKFDPKDAI